MKTQTRLGVMLLALLMSSIIFATPAFAAEPQVSVNTAGESVYTKTIDMQLQAMPYASESSTTLNELLTCSSIFHYFFYTHFYTAWV
ncbi:hypothetical protein JNUCC74_04265 [Cerasibacillus sp. JNUCC 74]